MDSSMPRNNNTFSDKVTLSPTPESIRTEIRVPDASELEFRGVEKSDTGISGFHYLEERVDQQDVQAPLLTTNKNNEEEEDHVAGCGAENNTFKFLLPNEIDEIIAFSDTDEDTISNRSACSDPGDSCTPAKRKLSVEAEEAEKDEKVSTKAKRIKNDISAVDGIHSKIIKEPISHHSPPNMDEIEVEACAVIKESPPTGTEKKSLLDVKSASSAQCLNENLSKKSEVGVYISTDTTEGTKMPAANVQVLENMLQMKSPEELQPITYPQQLVAWQEQQIMLQQQLIAQQQMYFLSQQQYTYPMNVSANNTWKLPQIQGLQETSAMPSQPSPPSPLEQQQYPLGNNIMAIGAQQQQVSPKNPSVQVPQQNLEEQQKRQILAHQMNMMRGSLTFDQRIEELKIYKLKFGDCNVPNKDNFLSLGNWCIYIRAEYICYKKDGINPNLNEDMIQALTKLGFEWEPKSKAKATKASRCKSFDQWFAEYKAFKEKFGENEEPKAVGEYKALSSWCTSIRSSYKDFKEPRVGKNRRSTRAITQKQIDCLEKYGFKWSYSIRKNRGKTFEERVEELKEFKKIHGHCYVTRLGKYVSLGNWCTAMRNAYHLCKKDPSFAEKYDDTKLKILEDIGFQWSRPSFLKSNKS